MDIQVVGNHVVFAVQSWSNRNSLGELLIRMVMTTTLDSWAGMAAQRFGQPEKKTWELSALFPGLIPTSTTHFAPKVSGFLSVPRCGRYKITQLAVYTIILYEVSYYLVVAYMGLAIMNRGYLIYIFNNIESLGSSLTSAPRPTPKTTKAC